MAMGVPLSFLDGVDHIRYRLDIFLLVLRDLLDAFSMPADIVPVGELRFVIDSTVTDIHADRRCEDRCNGPYAIKQLSKLVC